MMIIQKQEISKVSKNARIMPQLRTNHTLISWQRILKLAAKCSNCGEVQHILEHLLD